MPAKDYQNLQKFSITELELCGLAKHIANFSHLFELTSMQLGTIYHLLTSSKAKQSEPPLE